MMHVLVTVAWFVALAWLYKFIEAVFGFRKVPNLALPQTDPRPEGQPSVVVIVPACNEQDDIADCIESLLRQDCVGLRIIAVNDRSTDATGAVLGQIAARARDKLQVLHIKDLPPGWLGKTHALALAAREAIAKHNPQYLLFTDGDVVFDPAIVRRALAYATASGADHFVVMPTTIAMSWREAAILSFLQVTSLWAIRPWRVADPRAKRDALGVGAFNLVRTTAYRQIGGFEATPMEVLEDLYLGRRIKWAGLKQDVAVAPGMVQVHWAVGARGIIRGMTKNIYAVFRFRSVLLLAAAAGMLLLSVGPAVCAVFPPTRAAGCLALAAVFGLYALSARANRISPLYFLAFPFAGMAVVYAMLRSMVVTVRNRGIVWRGTFYRIDELRRHMVRSPE